MGKIRLWHAVENDFNMDRPPASFLLYKSWSKRFGQDVTPPALVCRTNKSRSLSRYTFCLGLVVFVIGIYLRVVRLHSPFVDSIIDPPQVCSETPKMVSPSSVPSWATLMLSLIGSLAARVACRSPTPATTMDKPVAVAATSTYTYTHWTVSAIQALQHWYNETEGLWDSTGWWNSGNCLTVLGDFYSLNAKGAEKLGLDDIFSNTFTEAQNPDTLSQVQKVFRTTSNGLRIVESRYSKTPVARDSDLVERGFSGFLNDYYDDEGWWALAWIRAYDVTGIEAYLEMAESIFHDMHGGVNATCGGGIWWNKDRTDKNAIANELYLSVAASLANRASSASFYLSIAEGQWEWFRNSGMMGSDYLINDGLVIYTNGTCVNDQKPVWSYNQGVILGGLVELYRATWNSSFLHEATNIAEAAIDALSVDGILHESCENDDCGADGAQFKGSSQPPPPAPNILPSALCRLADLHHRCVHAQSALPTA